MKKILYLLIGTTIISACSGTAETKEKESSNTQESNTISQCLAGKDYKYEVLLTKADIAKYVNINESSFKEEVSPIEGKYGSCVYSWESDRPEIERVIAGRSIKHSDNNKVTIKMFDVYKKSDLDRYKQGSAIELFDQAYKKLSQTEYDELMVNFEKELGNKPKELSQAKKLLDTRMKFKYKPIDDLGDRAYWKWDDYGIELVTLIGNAKFTVLSKTTGEQETSLDHAVHFAKEVLAKCAG